MLEIGRRLGAARKESGLKQKQVAAYLGVPAPMISYWENGQRDIDLDALSRLADLYGYSLGSIIGPGEGEKASMAFRAGKVSEEDLQIVAWAKKFALNLSMLGNLLKGMEDDAE